jgi:hypothetical protein
MVWDMAAKVSGETSTGPGLNSFGDMGRVSVRFGSVNFLINQKSKINNRHSSIKVTEVVAKWISD